MPTVVLTPLAREDFLQIWGYIAGHSDEETADSFVTRLAEKCEIIATSPLGYRMRDELLPGLRSFPFRSYMIFYVPITDGIEVIRVLHSARDIDSIFHPESD